MCLILPCIFIFSPTILKEVSKISPITFQAQCFYSQSLTLDFIAPCSISPPSHFCDFTLSCFSSHSSLAAASQFCLISVCLVHASVLVPLSPLSTLSSTWSSPTLTCQFWAQCEKQTCLSNCPVWPPKQPSNSSNTNVLKQNLSSPQMHSLDLISVDSHTIYCLLGSNLINWLIFFSIIYFAIYLVPILSSDPTYSISI